MNERALFEAALEIQDPAQRQAFVDRACADKPELRTRVEELLKSHDAAESFLNLPVVEQLQPGSPPPERTLEFPPRAGVQDDDEPDVDGQIEISFLQPSTKPGSIGTLGHYEVLQVVGRGAFGIVLKAFDEKLHRIVAIKVMNPQMAATSPPRKRFLREARAAAAVKHENVVQVYSVEEQPLPYLVMEFIDGQTLKQKLDSTGPLEAPEALHLARQIASGLAAAHAMGLIHRDIKPGNILLEQGAEQKVKITDFGLARAADDASMTQTGVVSGTPMYMAPEQAHGQPLDHRADLFSLGSVLYQMACGRPPFRASTTVAVLRRVVDDTPRPLQEILPEIPDWLVAIVTKLHAKKPEDRFQSAKEVADLLSSCQSELQTNGQVNSVPIPKRKNDVARKSETAESKAANVDLLADGSQSAAEVAAIGEQPPARLQNPATFAQRNLAQELVVQDSQSASSVSPSLPAAQHARSNIRRWLVAAAALVVVGTLAAVVIEFANRDRATTAVNAPDGAKVAKVPTPPSTPAGSPVSTAPLAIQPAPLPEIPGGEPLSPAAMVQRPAKIEGVHGWTIETVKPRGAILSALYSPDGKLVSVLSEDGTIRLLDANDGRLVRMLVAHTAHPASTLAWSPNSQILASSSISDNVVHLWDVKTGTLLRTWKVAQSDVAIPICWSPDGSNLAIASKGRLEIRNVANGKLLRSTTLNDESVGAAWPHECVGAAWSPDGKTIAIGAAIVGPCLVDAETLKLRGPVLIAHVAGLGWSSDSKRLFMGIDSHIGLATVCWEVETNKAAWETPLSYRGFGLACSPDGKTVARGSALLDAATGKIKTDKLPGVALTWSPKADTIISATGPDRSGLAFWDVASGQVVKTVEGLPPGLETYAVHWSYDGKALGVGGPLSSDPVLSWELSTCKPFDNHIANGYSPNCSPDGKLKLTLTGSIPRYGVKTKDMASGKEFTLLENLGAGWDSAAWSSDSSLVALAIGGAQIWNVQSRKRLHLLEPSERYWSLAFSPDGKLYAAGSDSIVRLRETASGNLLDTLRGHSGLVRGLSWSADGKTLTSSADDGMRDWEAITGRMVRHRPWRMGWPSPDGRFGSDVHVNTIRIWDLETGQRRLTIMPLPDDRVIAFSPDGHYRGTRPERDIVYVVQLDDGRQETLTPEEFSQRFGWKNAPEKVGLGSSANSTAEANANIDPDRRAAEWVLSIGGSIRINGQDQWISAAIPTEPFQLTGIMLGGGGVSDVGLAQIEDCKNVKVLALNGTAFTDTMLARFRHYTNLEHLFFEGMLNATDAGLAHLKECTKLRTLSLQDYKATETGLANFQNCKDLRSLSLFRTPVTDAGIANFKNCDDLEYLDLRATQVSDAGLAHFKNCRELKVLYLGRTQVTDAGLVNFTNCKELRELALEETGVTDNGLVNFRGCDELVSLSLHTTQVTDSGVAYFKNCKNLEWVDLAGAKVTGTSIEHLTNSTKLKILALQSTLVSDADLFHLQDCKRLSRLILQNTRVSDASLETLAGLPSLTELNVHGCRISRSGYEQLTKVMPEGKIEWSEPNRGVAEQVLALGGAIEIGTPGKDNLRPVHAADDLPNDYFQVRRISLNGVKTLPIDLYNISGTLSFPEFDRMESIDLSGTDVNGALDNPIAGLQELRVVASPHADYCIGSLEKHAGLKRLVMDNNPGFGNLSTLQLPQLEELSMANTGLTDHFVTTLNPLPKLQRLVLDGNPILGRCLAKLNEQPELIDLSLNCPSIGDLMAKNLSELKHIKRLSLVGANLSDSGIRYLEGLTNLTTLDLRKIKASAAGIEQLHQALPKCTIEWDGGTVRSQENSDKSNSEDSRPEESKKE